jgi:hypothetical protein
MALGEPICFEDDPADTSSLGIDCYSATFIFHNRSSILSPAIYQRLAEPKLPGHQVNDLEEEQNDGCLQPDYY